MGRQEIAAETEGENFSEVDRVEKEHTLTDAEISDESMDRLLSEVQEDDTSCKSFEGRHLPATGGTWEAERGDSRWVPDDDKVPKLSNPEEKSWAEIKDEYDIEGISFQDGDPDFSEVSRGEVEIDDFSEDRYKNFAQADQRLSEQLGCDKNEIASFRENNHYTWHECRDCKTMQLVPSEVHNNVVHSGGISEKKKEIKMEDWL